MSHIGQMSQINMTNMTTLTYMTYMTSLTLPHSLSNPYICTSTMGHGKTS